MEESPTIFVPAHITCFFDPHYDKNIFRSGSRGAGFSINMGAKVKVSIARAKSFNVEVFINGKREEALTTETAVRNLIGREPLNVRVDIEQNLPTSQGFGMSGAGALGASLAISKLFGIDKITAIKNAHAAEVVCKTGLGDVIAQLFGGIEIRKSPGLPPFGMIEHIPGSFEVVICVVGEKLKTKKILENESIMKKISMRGKYCLDALLTNPSVENLFSLSYDFMKYTGLADEKIRKIVDIANNFGRASMCMIGNSIFAVGDSESLTQVLSNFGRVYRAKVDTQGARAID